MTEVEELREQKRKIEARLREIKNGKTITCGLAKMDVEQYATGMPDRYYIAVECTPKHPGCYGHNRYRSILNGYSKEDMVAGLPEIIHDLQELYEKIKEDLPDAPE